MRPSLPLIISLLQLFWQHYHNVATSAFSTHRSCTITPLLPVHHHQNNVFVPPPPPPPPLGNRSLLPTLRTPPFSKAHIYATKEKANECVSDNDTATAATATSTSSGCSKSSGTPTKPPKKKVQKTLLSSTKNNIFSTIDLIIEAQQKVKCVQAKAQAKAKTNAKTSNYNSSSSNNNSRKSCNSTKGNIVATQPPMGILGEKVDTKNENAEVLISSPKKLSKLDNLSIEKVPIHEDGVERAATATTAKITSTTTKPGTILIPQRAVLSRTSLIFKNRLKDHISINVANESNDAEIANLRLSVFSDYSMAQRKEWIDKSCEVIRKRRLKGANCLAASVNYIDDSHSGDDDKEDKYLETRNWIIGSIECSTHEFHDSELGMRRPAGSILYITEVAVSPRTRRSGAGELLLKGMDKLAKRRKVETLYLHVDVKNHAACCLYKKAGYEILDSKNKIYSQFTTKLNLHDGATRGRRHHLMHKKLTKTQTWYPIPNQDQSASASSLRGTLGFEVFDS